MKQGFTKEEEWGILKNQSEAEMGNNADCRTIAEQNSESPTRPRNLTAAFLFLRYFPPQPLKGVSFTLGPIGSALRGLEGHAGIDGDHEPCKNHPRT